jgi:hypothetical protein
LLDTALFYDLEYKEKEVTLMSLGNPLSNEILDPKIMQGHLLSGLQFLHQANYGNRVHVCVPEAGLLCHLISDERAKANSI